MRLSLLGNHGIFAFGSVLRLDVDAQAYINAVELADGQPLENGVKVAINNFVVGCKQDGIWNAIKTSCILAGARTLNGALVPLVGSAPTNFNFVSGDYNRKTGLVGDGSTKYLNTNRNNNADPQNNNHQAVFVSTAQSASIVTAYIGAGSGSDTGATHIGVNAPVTQLFLRSRANIPATINFTLATTGVFGISRNNSTSFQYRFAGSTQTSNITSEVPFNGNVIVFNRFTSGSFSNARIAFYSVGESLDLALLDTRVTALLNAIGAAIP